MVYRTSAPPAPSRECRAARCSGRRYRPVGLPRPRDGGLTSVAIGDLRHDGALEIVQSTFSGKTYAWDGAGRLLPGFPVLNGSPSLYHMAVPSPDSEL